MNDVARLGGSSGRVRSESPDELSRGCRALMDVLIDLSHALRANEISASNLTACRGGAYHY